MDKQDFTFDDKFLRNYRFNSKGFSIISIEPVTINGTLYAKCKNGHSFETTFIRFMKKQECLECLECDINTPVGHSK